jgi:competence protein ComEC
MSGLLPLALAAWAGAAIALALLPSWTGLAFAAIGMAAARRRSLLGGCVAAMAVGFVIAGVRDWQRRKSVARVRDGPMRGWVHATDNSASRHDREHVAVRWGEFQVWASLAEPVIAGESLLVEGEVRAWPEAQWEGDVDARAVMSRHGLAATLRVDQVIERRNEPSWWEQLARARARLAAQLAGPDPSRGGAVAAAIITGDRRALTEDDDAQLRRGGIVHVLSVSGLHLSAAALVFFVAWRMGLGLALPWLAFSPRRWAAILSLPPMAAYCLFTGAELPAVRSAIMTAVVMVALLFGRELDGRRAFACALGACVALWPLSVVEPTFLFSFGSVLVLLLWAPRIGRGWWRQPLALLASSAVATLFSWPIAAYFFHRLACGGLWNNMWGVPLASAVMVPLGLVWLMLALCGYNAEPLAVVLRHCGTLLRYSGTIAPEEWAFSLRGIEVIGIWVLFASLFAPGRRRIFHAVLACALAVSVSRPWLARHLSRDLTAHFLPVGQGDGAALFAPGGAVWLVDGGGDPHGHWDPGERVVVPFLLWHRVSVVDDVVVTHAHPDHFAGLITVVNTLRVKRLWWSGHGENAMAPLLGVARARGVELHTFANGALPELPGGSVEKLHPSPSPDEAFFPEFGYNDNSLVLRLSFAGRRLLMTGDIENLAEDWLLDHARAQLSSDVLKIAHHGSRTSSSAEFLAAVAPRDCIISCGLGNRFGHPHAAVLNRLHFCETWRTDEQGLVSIVFSADGALPWTHAHSQLGMSPRAAPRDRGGGPRILSSQAD